MNFFIDMPKHRTESMRSFLFGILGVFLSVLFNFFTIRILNLIDYGLYASVNFLFNVVALGASSVQAVVALEMVQSNTITNYSIWKDARIRQVIKFSCLASMVFFFFLSILRFFLQGSFSAYLVLAIYIPAAALLSIAYGRLQASMQVARINSLSLLANFFKFLAFVPFLFVEINVLVLLYCLVLSSYVSAFFALKSIRNLGSPVSLLSGSHTRKIGLLAILFWTTSGIDLLFLRFALDGDEAGRYAIAATIARLMLTPVMIFSLIQYSFFAQNWPHALSISVQMFGRLVWKCTLISLISLVVLPIAGDSVLDLVMNDEKQVDHWDILSYQITLMPLILVIPLYYLLNNRVHLPTIVSVGCLVAASAVTIVFGVSSVTGLKFVLFFIGISLIGIFSVEYRRQKGVCYADK